jgi:thiamine biosynthesis protein ThiS
MESSDTFSKLPTSEPDPAQARVHLPSTPVTVQVNDTPYSVPPATTLTQLLQELELSAGNGMAVAINGVVVHRGQWRTQGLADGDQVLVIHATQGG